MRSDVGQKANLSVPFSGPIIGRRTIRRASHLLWQFGQNEQKNNFFTKKGQDRADDRQKNPDGRITEHRTHGCLLKSLRVHTEDNVREDDHPFVQKSRKINFFKFHTIA